MPNHLTPEQWRGTFSGDSLLRLLKDYRCAVIADFKAQAITAIKSQHLASDHEPGMGGNWGYGYRTAIDKIERAIRALEEE